MEEIAGPINVRADPFALKERPELATNIAVIAGQWSEIEEELTLLFVAGMRTEPAIAAAAFGNVFSVHTKLRMVETVLDLRFPAEAVTPFKRLAKRVRELADRRNRVVHAVWAVHPDHPDALLRLKGISDPQLQIHRYARGDFAEIQRLLVGLEIDLRQFAQSLAPYMGHTETEERERFWRLTEPRTDPTPSGRSGTGQPE